MSVQISSVKAESGKPPLATSSAHRWFAKEDIRKIISILPHPIKSIVRSINREYWRPSVCLCDASISLKDNNLRPNFIINLRPFIQHFLDVFLMLNERKSKIQLKSHYGEQWTVVIVIRRWNELKKLLMLTKLKKMDWTRYSEEKP